MGIREFTISFSGDAGKVVYRTERGDKEFPFRRGAYADTVFPETHYSGKRIQTPKGSGYRCLNAGVWKKEDTFLLRTYVIDDYFGNMAAVFRFAGDTVHLEMTKTAEWFLDEYVGTADGRKAKG